MELIYPWMLYIGILVVIILAVFLFIRFKRKDSYKKGKKVANTSLTEASPYYKKLWKQYKVFSISTLVALLITIATGFGLLSRPAEVETFSAELHNRDIFLCMDTSDSVDELNLEICNELRYVVKELKGERIGITIFNGKSVLLVPLTTDYNYVLETLDKLEASFKTSLSMSDWSYNFDAIDYESYYYKYEGTLADYGSSFIGDGLASCLYNFPDLEENSERTRMIIFTTDNDLNGTPHVTVEKAAELCQKHDVKVFAIAPDNIVDEAIFQNAMEETDGGYYRLSESGSIDDMLSDIKKTGTSILNETETIIMDKPQVLFVCLIVFIGIYFLLSRKVKL